MGFVRFRCRFGGRSLAAALLGTTFLVSLAAPALADSHLESENAGLRSQIEDLRQEVEILKNMVVQQGNKMMEAADAAAAAEPAAPPKMVSSGKDRVSLSLSGQVNRMLLNASDGNDSRLFHADNDQSSTRFRLKGKAKMDRGWSAGATFEAELESNSSGNVTIGDEKGGGDSHKASLKERKLELWIKSKEAGKVSIGQGSTASDGSVEEDLSGTGVITSAGFGGTGASLEFVDSAGGGSGTVVDDLFGNMDGMSRKDRLRYDSPSLGGFTISTSYLGQAPDGADTWDVAIRYGREWGDFEVAAAVAQWTKDGDTTGMGGSASLLAPSGTSFTLAHSREDSGGGSNPTFAYAKLGQALDLTPAGGTAVSVGFGSTDNQGGAGNSGSYYDVAVVQKLKSLGAELYGIYGVYDASIVGTPTNDITITGVGARIKF